MSIALEKMRARLPVQDLSRLSLVTATPSKVHEWISSLPKVNVGESVRQVYLTIQELNRLPLDPKPRLGILEALRPTVYFLCEALSRHYLGQPVVLSEKSAKIATLAQALHNHLAIGYKLLCLQLIGQKPDVESIKILTLAAHRTLSGMGSTYLRCCQLYLNPPPFFWLELHGLFFLINRIVSTQKPVTDPANKLVQNTSIEDAYYRSLLLATSRPYQLRQTEIAYTYETIEQWSGKIKIHNQGSEDRMYVFNPEADAPPMYASQSKFIAHGPLQALVLEDLVARLQDLLLAHRGNTVAKSGEEFLSAELLRHLIHAWGDLSERSFKRTQTQGKIEVSIGMTCTHYYVSDGKTLDQTVKSQVENTFVDRLHNIGVKADPWAGTYSSHDQADVNLGNIEFQSASNNADNASKFLKYKAQITNTSPGGYGLSWTGEMPVNVRNGELVGIFEQNNSGFSIGVIRWLRQLPGMRAEFGLEILSPQASACAVKLVRKNGETSEYIRSIVLPELQNIGRPATLLVPNVIFKSGSEILLNNDGEESKVILGRIVMSTSSICQFEFDDPDSLKHTAKKQKSSDDFDSIWSSL